MNKRQSIYVGKHLNDMVTSMLCQGKSQSGIINQVVNRYQVVVNRNIPELPESEWLELMKCLQDYDTNNIIQAVNGLAGTVADAGLNVPSDFANRINELYFEEKMAIIHVSELFNAGNGSVAECGGRII